MLERTALVMCRADPNGCPRPLRMIRSLQPEFKVTSLGTAKFHDDRVQSLVLPALPLHSFSRLKRVGALILHRYNRLLWSHELTRLATELRGASFDLIVCHDPDLLPLALSSRSATKVLFDAREYYPLHFEDSRTWRLLYQPLNEYLCASYLPRCDRVITVSEGLARAYERSFGVRPRVVESLPAFHDLQPSPVDPGHIRIVHHGNATRSRNIEGMIRVMDHLPERFSLDLFLMATDPDYHRRLCQMAEDRLRVTIRAPLRYTELIPTTNRNDIGLFLCPPTTFNLRHSLPNKLFEFIQARLAVAIGPLPDQSAVLRRYGCGLVASNFHPTTMADLLMRTETTAFQELKQRSHKAAAELNLEAHQHKITELVERMLSA